MQYQGCVLLSLDLLFILSIVVGAENIPINQTCNDYNLISEECNSQSDFRYECTEENNLPWCLPEHYDNEIEPWKYRHLGNLEFPWRYYFGYNIYDIQEQWFTLVTVILKHICLLHLTFMII